MTLFRMLAAATFLAVSAFAAPPLTTIQDVLYKADGTRFNGTLNISWNSFEAPDGSAIATQVTTIKVTDGNLRVQLVPNSNSNPPAYYSVVYNSDGRVQFSETWAVPAVSQQLRIRDVRVAANLLGNATSNASTIQESQVVGLVADLAARPVKGPAFSAGRVALINSLGALDGVSGYASDCVHVDGSSGPCGAAVPSFIDGDIPSGIVDGANTQFTLSGTPSPASSLKVYLNGLLETVGTDYTLGNNRVIQFAAASVPQPGDTLIATYRVAGSSSTAQLFPAAQVLCAGAGATINTTSFSSLGKCIIPANTLSAGDRVEILFDLTHQGSASGFSAELHWGGTTILHKDATAGDAQVTARVDAGLTQTGARTSAQAWGTLLPFGANVGSASDAYTGGLTIDFQGKLSSASDTLTLPNFAVVRLP